MSRIFSHARWRMEMVIWVGKAPIKINQRFVSNNASAVGIFQNSVIGVSNTGIIRHFDSRTVDSEFSFILDQSIKGLSSITSVVRATTNDGNPYEFWVRVEKTDRPVLTAYDNNGSTINLSQSNGWFRILSDLKTNFQTFANFGVSVT